MVRSEDSLSTITWSRHSLRIEPISRSTNPFCQENEAPSELPECSSRELPTGKYLRSNHLDLESEIVERYPRGTPPAIAATSIPQWDEP